METKIETATETETETDRQREITTNHKAHDHKQSKEGHASWIP